MVISLSKELLGPRKGPRERIAENPRGEYLVGVLEPKDFARGALDFYGRPDFQTVEAGVAEDDDVAEEAEPALLGLRLDPRALPKTVGISFVVNARRRPLIGLCATWARYIGNQQKGWQRVPYRFIKHNIDVRNDAEWSLGEGVRISLRRNTTSDGNHHVSIYLVNETPLSGRKYPRTEDLIFQPQLRIVCEEGASIIPIIGEQMEEEEEASLSLLYRHRTAMARGHFCGATWKEVDPERPWSKTRDSRKSPSGHPFAWVDAELLEEPERSLFTNPDVRTEYLPCYPIEQVVMKPRLEGHLLKKLKAEALAEAWDPSVLGTFLDPIPDAYTLWIKRQRDDIAMLPQRYRSVAERHMMRCEEAEHRIREGIDILKNDDEARLAFCFMNEVMHQQSMWTRKEPLVWRLFQVAFILEIIPGVVQEDHPDRSICDVLWFPTAAGKTEAYLGLTIFNLALRRRRNRLKETGGAGTAVLSRYTLRMLTIQQFRRALVAITACDYLRVMDWRPTGYPEREENLWGTARFSIGLWVGGEVTPNHLVDHKGWDARARREIRYPGAVTRLMGFDIYRGRGLRVEKLMENEPAQILNCPACGTILAVPTRPSLPSGEHIIHWLVSSRSRPNPRKVDMNGLGFMVKNVAVTSLPNQGYYVVSITFSSSQKLSASNIDRWWKKHVQPALGRDCKGAFARASRPGYFIRRCAHADVYREAIDFEIHCPNPQCELNRLQWFEYVPGPSREKEHSSILRPFQIPGRTGFASGVPISAYVVDDQVYHRCPSLVIATVDKFARLSYEPRAAAIFGNVNKFDTCWGFYRDSAPPDTGGSRQGDVYPVPRFEPPNLIIQDELHLIEGPLGSMVGIYETAIDILASKSKGKVIIRPKYVASSATIRHVSSQVTAVFDRKAAVFPPPGLSVDDNFFSYTREAHPLDSGHAGRLYVGVCAPGRGPHTPTIRIWSALLRQAYEERLAKGSDDQEVDQFWTVVGYFNAIRELAAAVSLFRADIRERLRQTGGSVRPLEPHLELSSRMESSEIPGALEQLSRFPDNKVDAAFATSMFGTGVDVERLGLMIVHGQPKTTANYIQATGRVGRLIGGLVVTFLRATRPRDLDHYEFFAGYHRSLSRYVEPITVHPFSPRARERALGPVAVALLRNADTISGTYVSGEWGPEDLYVKLRGRVAKSGSRRMGAHRRSPEVLAIVDVIEARGQHQPAGCRPRTGLCRNEVASELDKWEATAKSQDSLIYYEPTMIREPQNPVVLGDPQHEARGLTTVFRNAPQSLREVESTATFEG